MFLTKTGRLPVRYALAIATALAACSGGPAAPAAPPAAEAPHVARVVSAAVGGAHVCAALDDGALYCWGRNDHGQLGTGDRVDRLTPTRVASVSGVTQVAAGVSNTCVATRTGQALCWGANGNYQIGNGRGGPYSEDILTPAVLAGVDHAVALDITIDSCAVLTSGQLVCWGGPVHAPRSVAHAGAEVIASSSGGAFRCVLHRDGTVACMGSNLAGELGDGTDRDHMIFRVVPGIEHAVAIAAASTGICALIDGGGVTCWGWGTRAPQVVDGMSSVVAIGAVNGVRCAAARDGRTYCWGTAERGLIPGSTGTVPQPVVVPGLEHVASFANAGAEHFVSTFCAVHEDGHLLCWGSNTRGELGTGTTSEVGTPVRIPLPGTAGGS
jgi:alpha-tubulin suppressor-like RCC1 family protein